MKISHAFNPFTVVDRTVQTYRTVSCALRTQNFSKVQRKTSFFQLSFNLLTQRRGWSQNRAVLVLRRSPWIFHLLEIFYPVEYTAYLLITVKANNHFDTCTHTQTGI